MCMAPVDITTKLAQVSFTRTMSTWFVYIVRCADDTLYTGIARDVDRRVGEHNNNPLTAAKYTRARRPVSLVYQEACDSRSQASKREHQIKQLSRVQKQQLIMSPLDSSPDIARH